jgi:hypothetical protein
MIPTAATLVALALAAPGTFEGRADYQLAGTGPHAVNGTVTIWMGKDGVRFELAGRSPELAKGGGPGEMRVVTITRAAEPNRTYVVNDVARTYAVSELQPGQGEPPEYRVEKLGKTRIAGYGCERARITGADGRGQEACITQDLGALPALDVFGKQHEGNVTPALRKAGLDGLPVQWKTVDADGSTTTLELRSARRQKVPAGKLAVPKGYQETGITSALAVTPEQQKEMDAALKQLETQLEQLPPEQRKKVEEMLRKQRSK